MDIFEGEIMKAKIYDFKYSNIGHKLAVGFFSFCANLAVPIVTFYIILFAMGLCGIGKYLSIELWLAFFVFSVTLGIILAIRFCFCFKGVILYDSCLEIITQNIGFGKNKPKITINYSDIASVFNSTFNIRYDRRKARKTFIAGDYSNYIELTLKGGKQFCFSVENQKEFLDELILRMNNFKNNS